MLKKYKSAFISPIVVMLFFGIFFWLNGFFPFGKSSVSWCDMTQQVIPLLCDFKDMLNGDDGFFLSLHNAGGMNFYGVFFFFLASPFSFLVAIVEKADIPLLLNVILVLKLCVCAITASIYFEKRFSNLNLLQKITLAVSYALCGYGMMFYQNIIWLDVMYLFPILMLGIHTLIEKEKPWLFIATLTAIVVVNFYISYMVILFVLLYFGIHLLYSKAKDHKLFFNLGTSVAVALMLSAVVWVPSFAQYSSSGRKESIIEGLKNSDFFAYIETSVPILLSTSLVFAVLIAFLPNLASKTRAIKTAVLSFGFMCVPVFIEPVNRMWHTGDYMSFPVRYGFITIFLGFVVCAELLNDAQYQKGKTVANVSIIIVVLLAGMFGILYSKKHIDILSSYARTLWGDTASYRGILALFLVLLFVGVLTVLLAKRGLVSKKVLSLCLAIIVLSEGYSSLLIYISPSKDDLNMTRYSDFCSVKESVDDDSFYRVNMSEKLIDANMTGAIGFGSLGHYTSLTDDDYMSAIKGLGYSGYWMEIGNWGGNVISDALMSVKYTVREDANGFYIEQNPLSLGLVIPSWNKLPKEFPKTDRPIAVGEIYKSVFSLKENPVTQYEITDLRGCDYAKVGNDHILTRTQDYNCIEYIISVSGKQTLYLDCFNGGSNNLEEPINNALSVYVNSLAKYYPSQNENGMLNLGTFSDTTVTVRLVLNKDISCYSFGVFGFDMNAITSAAKGFDAAKVDIKPNRLTTNIPKNYNGEVFISLPYNEGYRFTLNGEKIEYNRCLTGFMSINIQNGGELKISFVPPKFFLGLVISLLGIAALVLLYLFKERLENLPPAIYKITFVLFLAVFIGFLIAVYIGPIVINLISK